VLNCVLACLLPCPTVSPQKINEFGRKARDGTLSIDEMAGGTFTIRWEGHTIGIRCREGGIRWRRAAV
jgi:pyruvate/2-oxoglutarate dehydrogenase complex dihydrolipoamide acyltransferase (E2) component